MALPLVLIAWVERPGYGLRDIAWLLTKQLLPTDIAPFAPAGIAGDNTIFNTVFFVVAVSTLVQGLTLEPFARRLGLTTGSS